MVADKAQTHCPPFDFTHGGEQVEPRLAGLVFGLMRTAVV